MAAAFAPMLSRTSADRGALEELKADIGRMMEGQLRGVVAELRADIGMIMQKLNEEFPDEAMPRTPRDESCKDLARSSRGEEEEEEGSRSQVAKGAGVAVESAPEDKSASGEPPKDSGDDAEVPGPSHSRTRAMTPRESWMSNLLGGVAWEWQHQDGSWEPYPRHTCLRIEQAFWRGETMIHVKSGKEGDSVMEIFFVDMVQLDPASDRVRPIRRSGRTVFSVTQNPWMWIRRHTSRVAYEIATGRPQLETMKDYKKREKEELSSTGLRMEEAERRGLNYIGVNVDLEDEDSLSQQLRQMMESLTTSVPFVVTSMLATILQAVYMVVTLANANDEDDIGVIDYLFCFFFLVELLMRYLALNRISEGARDAWFCFDFICVAFSVIELVFLPLVELDVTVAQGVRVVRLGRMFRFARLFRQFKDLRVVIRGLVFGMRSVIYILVLMAILIFVFGVCIQANIGNTELKTKYFNSLGRSMMTLLFCGIILDGAEELGSTFIEHSEYAAMIMFFIFLLISYFGLLNMMIGSFCNTAMLVSQQESYDADLQRLALNLKGLMECYLAEGDQTMNRQQFRLIMKNMHVHKILRSCGTDIEALLMLEDVLFPTKDSKIHYNNFFGVVARLRASAPACVSHVVAFTATMDHLFQELKQTLENSRRRHRSRTAHSLSGSAPSYGLWGLEHPSVSRVQPH